MPMPGGGGQLSRVQASILNITGAGDPIVTTVNGTKIMRSDVTQAYGQLPDQYKQVPFEQIFPALLDSLIDTKLAAGAARKAKIKTNKEKRNAFLMRATCSYTCEGRRTVRLWFAMALLMPWRIHHVTYVLRR